MEFASTYTSWLYGVNIRLLLYCELTLADLPQVAPALRTWHERGASAWLVANAWLRSLRDNET